MIYYNGAGTNSGVPAVTIPGVTGTRQCVWEFQTNKMEWVFHSNKNNYEKEIIKWMENKYQPIRE